MNCDEKTTSDPPSSGKCITLGEILKLHGLAVTGGQAKWMIQNGQASVNGEVCRVRGKKLASGDLVEINGSVIRVKTP